MTSAEEEAPGRPIPSAARDVPQPSLAHSGSFTRSFMDNLAAAGAIGSFRGREHSMLENRTSLGRRPSDAATISPQMSRNDSFATEVLLMFVCVNVILCASLSLAPAFSNAAVCSCSILLLTRTCSSPRKDPRMGFRQKQRPFMPVNR